MMKIASQSDTARIDKTFLQRTGGDETGLVGAAGAAVGTFLVSDLKVPVDSEIAVLCGAGNNGADGFAAAAHLRKSGFGKVRVFSAKSAEELRPSAAWFHRGVKAATTDISSAEKFSKAKPAIARAGVVVDCLLGTGVKSPLTGLYADIVNFVNSLSATKISVDLPSGFYADSPELPPVFIQPDWTFCIALPKKPLVMGPGKYRRGRLVVRNIGFDEDLLRDPSMTMNWYTDKEAKEDVPARPGDSFKGYFGHCGIWAGSEGKTGAARLASAAALRTGAGLVTVLCDPMVRQAVASGTPEVMSSSGVFEAPPGGMDGEMKRFLEDKTVILAGPGLGTSEGTREYFRSLVRNWKGPLVLDADAINMLSMEHGLRDEFKGELVLTPHPGEMSRLLGTKIGTIDEAVIRDVVIYAKRMNAWIVLKSADTLVFNPSDGQVWLNSTGNAGLAKAGSGDVLAGIVAGVLSQKFGLRAKLGTGFDLGRALCFAVWLHGKAADLAADGMDKRSMIATDVINYISPAYRTLQSRSSP